MGNICKPTKQASDQDLSKQDPKQKNDQKGDTKNKVDNTQVIDYKPLGKFVRNDELLKAIKRKIKSKQDTTDEPQSVFEHCLKCFDKFDKWEFPMAEFARLMEGHTLFYIMYAVFIKHDIIKKFNFDESTLLDFFEEIQSNYHNNPFSNATHAAETVLAFNYLIRRGLSQYLSEEDIFVCFIAAMAIDLDHPGLNNEFQAERETHLATIYNDLSILENHSSTLLFSILKKYKLLDNFSKEQRPEIRELIMEMILATDMVEHQTYYDAFAQRMTDHCEFSNREDVRNLLQVALKLCDHAYLSKGKRAFNYWISAQLAEQYNQGDLEKKLKMKVAKGCEREEHASFTNLQIQKMEQVKELLKQFTQLLSKSKFICDVLRKNLRYWNQENTNLLDEFDERSFQRIDYETFEKKYDEKQRAVPVDDNQDRVIPLEEQNEKRHNPSQEQKDIEMDAKAQLVERFDVENKAKFAKITETPVVYSLVDYKDGIAKENITKSIVTMFDRLDDWNFDVFATTALLGNHAMFLTSWTLFTKYDLLKKFNIKPDILSNFLRRVQTGYQYNPYHNAMHACDVMQITNAIMVQGDMLSKMNDIDIMAGIISSMVHDYDHPGLNNAFQTHSWSYLANIYNDRSVLENHHCSQTFHIMRTDPECNIFSGMSHSLRQDARKTMVGMIISTDMTNHGKYVKAFNNRIEASANFTEKDDIRIALQIAIKMADVSNPSRPLYLYLQWTDSIIREFYMQGDKELENNLPVSPLMDRRNPDIPKGQIAFMVYVIIPMFNSFTTIFPGMKFALEHIQENKAYWETHTAIDPADFDPNHKKENNDE